MKDPLPPVRLAALGEALYLQPLLGEIERVHQQLGAEAGHPAADEQLDRRQRLARANVEVLPEHAAEDVVKHELAAGERRDLQHARAEPPVQPAHALVPVDELQALHRAAVPPAGILRDEPRAHHVQRQRDDGCERAAQRTAHKVPSALVPLERVDRAQQMVEPLVRGELRHAVNDRQDLGRIVALPERPQPFLPVHQAGRLHDRAVLGRDVLLAQRLHLQLEPDLQHIQWLADEARDAPGKASCDARPDDDDDTTHCLGVT
uniref:Uncharacterized protein n=1 Tax=Anopheles coluzzii TaxID=1518534 RepID=A0A8W7PNS9_ANOCL